MSDKTKNVIVRKYLQLAKKNKLHPSRAELINNGISRDRIRAQFGNYSKLKEHIKEHNAKDLVSVIDDELFSKKKFNDLNDKLKKHKRFVITTALTGSIVHKGFLKSLENYCKVEDACLLILLATDPASSENKGLDPVLEDKNIITSNTSLNKSLFLSTIKLSAKHIDPITGLERLSQKNGSFIYAAPKQRLKMVATSNTSMPCAVMTTGALTKPNYNTTRYMSNRTAHLAENDHTMGAVIAEIKDSKVFHFRQIQANSLGHFIDLGKLYKEKEVKDYPPSCFVLGDWHSGETDPTAKRAWLEVSKELKVPKLIIHDGFNGKSINHHEAKNSIAKARLAIHNNLSLEDELKQYVKDLNELTKERDVVIVKSNHDDFLYRYLSEGTYVYDPINYLIGSKLSTAALQGKDVLREALEGLIGLEHPERVRWLDRDEDYKIANIELGAHGDKGANGSRGSLKSMEAAYGYSVSGHSHTPQILRGAWAVGTSSYLKLSYNKGPSSWCHTSCLVYENGMRQLINSINGEWRLKK